MIGVQTVSHGTKRCCRRTCRTTYGYNYYWDGSRNINAVSMTDLHEGVLFVSSKRCYTLRYLRFMADLHFRGFVSSKAVTWAYERSFAGVDGEVLAHCDQNHTEALMYFLTLQEFDEIGLQSSIVLGDEVSGPSLRMYEQHLHDTYFVADNADTVKTLVGDGHVKVCTKCTERTQHAGRPRSMKKQRRRRYTNGWFMVCEPSGKVLACKPQLNPENNAHVAGVFAAALSKHPHVNCIVYDRNCGLAPGLKEKAAFTGVKYWPIDKFHGERHSAKCRYSPKNNKAYKRRLRGVNTVVCEQLFAWFRNYARALNEMRPNRQMFLVLHYVKRHNLMLSQGDRVHLGSLKRRRTRGTYPCSH